MAHRHLRIAIEDACENENDVEVALRLINELRYSNLFIPAKRQNGSLDFIVYEDGDVKITPLFTDEVEFRKFFAGEDLRLLQNPFLVYQNILKKTDIEAYIINPSSERYMIDKELVMSIRHMPKTNFFSNNPYSEDELRELYGSIDNASLEEFISNRFNVGDYEGLFEELTSSTLLTLMLSDINLDGDLISLKRTGPIAYMYTDRIGGIYATVFTSSERFHPISTAKFQYGQIVNLATLVNFILTEDMDGLIINPESDNVLIPRAVLLRYSRGFEKFTNDERLSEAMYYIFPQ